MINPLENNGFKHELKFYDFNTDWYEIPEPIGLTAADPPPPHAIN